MNRIDPRYFLVLGVVTLMTFVSWWINDQSLIGIDDANIYFVYMKNVANGNGFVFNVGGERVEGFTSLLWTLIGSVVFRLSSNPELILILISVLVVSFSLWRMVVFIDETFGTASRISPYSIVFLGMVALVPGYFEWTTLSIMETGLWSSLLILISLNILRYEKTDSKKISDRYFCVLLFLILLCRPESMLWGVFFLVSKAYLHYQLTNGDFSKIAKGMVPGVLVFCLTLTLIFTWRMSYFGYLFPNTYYAKISSDIFQNFKLGVLYLYDYMKANPIAIIIVFLVLHVLVTQLKSGRIWKEFQLLFLSGVGFLTFFIPLYSGGDHFGHFRFIQPTAPVIYLAFLFALSRLGFVLNNTWAFLIVLFSFSSAYFNFINLKYYGTNNPIVIEWELAVSGRKNSEQLNIFFDRLKKFPTQGVFYAGGSSYLYKGFSYDLLGHNDVAMAHANKIKSRNIPKNHASFNKEIFFHHQPDIFWLAGEFVSPVDTNSITPHPWVANVFKNLHEDEQFKKSYPLCLITKTGTDQALKIFASKSFIASLDSTLYTVKLL